MDSHSLLPERKGIGFWQRRSVESWGILVADKHFVVMFVDLLLVYSFSHSKLRPAAGGFGEAGRLRGASHAGLAPPLCTLGAETPDRRVWVKGLGIAGVPCS